MKRSPPQDKVVVKKIETTGKDFDDDKKYLVDWLIDWGSSYNEHGNPFLW